jgi:hypothetical protein
MVIASDPDTLANFAPSAPAYDENPAWTANIPAAMWIWESYYVQNPQQNESVLFGRQFNVSGDVAWSYLTVAADNNYRAYANLDFVAQDNSGATYANPVVYNLGSKVKNGTNNIAITVNNWAVDGGSPTSNPAGLLYRIDVCYKSATTTSTTSTTTTTLPQFANCSLACGASGYSSGYCSSYPIVAQLQVCRAGETSVGGAGDCSVASGIVGVGKSCCCSNPTTTTTTSTTLPPAIPELWGNVTRTPQGSFVNISAVITKGTWTLDRWWFTYNGTLGGLDRASEGYNSLLWDTTHLLGTYHISAAVNDTRGNMGYNNSFDIIVYTTTTTTTTSSTSSTTLPSCFDSDGGIDLLSKGFVVGSFEGNGPYNFTDTCSSQLLGVVREYYCNQTTGLPASVTASCVGGMVCSDGACQTTTTTTLQPPLACNESLMVVLSNNDTLANSRAAVLAYSGNPIWTANIPGASWIWDSYLVQNPEVGHYVAFSRQLNVPGTVLGSRLTLAADNSFAVYLNNHFVAEDASVFNYNRTTVLNGLGLVSNGSNELEFTVLNQAVAGSTSYSNPAGLLYKLEVCYRAANPATTTTTTTTTTLAASTGGGGGGGGYQLNKERPYTPRPVQIVTTSTLPLCISSPVVPTSSTLMMSPDQVLSSAGTSSAFVGADASGGGGTETVTTLAKASESQQDMSVGFIGRSIGFIPGGSSLWGLLLLLFLAALAAYAGFKLGRKDEEKPKKQTGL